MQKSDKPKEVQKLKRLMEEHGVVGLLNMHNLPAKQLQKIRDRLRGVAIIRMGRKSLLKRALESAKNKDIKQLEEKIIDEPALILSNENPFRLFKILKESRTSASAKAGNTAMSDIIIKQGKTSIPPGPAISALQKLGLKTSVQDGKIAIMADKVAAKTGEIVTDDMVNAFNLLKMEPMEIGLDMIATWEGGIIYTKDVLDIDVNDYMNRVSGAINHMINLSIETGYLVPITAEMSIQKAFLSAKALALEAGIIDKSIIDELLMKAVREASELSSLVPEAPKEKETTKESNDETVDEKSAESKEDVKEEEK